MFSILMICTAAYIFGIMISPEVSLTTTFLLAGCMLAAGLLVMLVSGRKNPVLFLVVIFAVLGSIRCYSAFENRLYYEFPNKYVTVTGTIDSTPMKGSGEYKYRYTLRADTVSYLGNAYSVNSKIKLSSKKRLDFGDKVQASGFLNEIKGKNNETDFDYSVYYNSLGIKNYLTAFEIKKCGRDIRYTPTYLAGMIKSAIYNNIEANYSGDDAALLYAVILGDKSHFSTECRTRLLRTGIMHTIFSPYVHIMLLTMLAGLLCGNNRNRREFLLLCLLMVYALFNSSSPTIIKSAFIGAIVILRKKIAGFSNKADVLAAVMLAMTLIDPLLCFNGGFVMSAVSTLLIYLTYEPLYARLSPFLNKIFFGIKKLSSGVVLWIILTLGTLPLGAYYFNGISLYSMLYAPLLIPFTALLLLLSPALFLFPGIGAALPFLRHAGDLSAYVLKTAPAFIEKLPFYYIMLGKPEILEIITFYLVWWIVIRILRGKFRSSTTYALGVTACAFVLCLTLDFSVNSLDIYFVNVGQGDGAVLHTDAGETILIDGGGSADYQKDYDIGERVYLPYLIAHGFTHVNTAVISHFHKDHAEGIIAAAENLRVDNLVMPDAMPDSIYRQKLEEIAQRRGINIQYVSEGDELNFNSGLVMKILAPDSAQLSGADENDTSIVAELHYGDFTALFTGDSSDSVNDSYAKDIDLLKVSHHGSETANGADFVNHVSPKYAVISVGTENTYGLPNKSVLKRYMNEGAQILRTDLLGDIHFKVSRSGEMKYSSFRGR
ncbi:MAG: DNA internalization-related competence protein ComEC/Rec2 [Clostridiales bacterium]|nr:DNA internalization-related competence protein ComEC/Rec2 [Clostridiales bacterium]